MNNLAHAPKATAPKTANYNTLDRIVRLIVDCEGTGDLTPFERILCSLYVALARMGYDSAKVTLESIVRRLKILGQGKCLRTVKAAQTALETRGYIRRQKFRIGPDHFVSVIHFQPRLLSYISRYVQKSPEVDLTSTRVSCNSQLCFNKAPAPAPVVIVTKSTFKKGTNQKKEHRDHPVYYSLRCATQGMQSRRAILARAFCEIHNPVLRSTGLDWQPIIATWQTRTILEKEAFCREVLIPALETMPRAARPERRTPKSSPRGHHPKDTAPRTPPRRHRLEDTAPRTPPRGHRPEDTADLKTLLVACCADLDSVCSAHPIKNSPQKNSMDVKGNLSPEDRKILSAAKSRAFREDCNGIDLTLGYSR